MVRSYRHDTDYEAVGEFLVRTFGSGGPHVNWLQPRWEYMHHHPYVVRVDLASIGVWESEGSIVAVAHPELSPGTVYLEVDPSRRDLLPAMVEYAERHLRVPTPDGRRLKVFVNEADHELQRLVAARGYARTTESEPMSRLPSDEIPSSPLPNGFRVQSLAEDDDLRKVHRLLWRGFDHGDEPPDEGLEERRRMQSAPNFRRDLNLVAVAPDETFVAYGGLWFEPVHRVAYVEPVATDPDYRRRGLGRAVVLEGVRRCAAEGATAAYVGTTQPFYRSMGFRPIYDRVAWQRTWPGGRSP